MEKKTNLEKSNKSGKVNLLVQNKVLILQNRLKISLQEAEKHEQILKTILEKAHFVSRKVFVPAF